MTTTLTLIGTYVLFALWQSTLWLAAVWMLGKLYRREPWKAHWLYVMGIFAAMLTPLLSTVISMTSGGMLTVAVPQWIEPQRFQTDTLGMFCLAGAMLFTILLLFGIASSRRLMFHAVPFPDRESQDALLRHSKTLRNVSLPILFTSPSVKSPTVWCWGLHPAVLLPESLADKLGTTERDAVFLHELSHIIRRDHLTALFTRLCGALLFWNPLYWLVLWQSDLSADEACDHVVLAQGNIPPEQYTDTLLRLVAGERLLPILQPFSRKEKIMKRIEQIQSPLRKQGSPAGSRLWTASVFSTALLLCVTLAFCQGQPISPEKAMMMGYVENYFRHNARDIAMRKSLEWGEVQTDDDGSRTIRYKYEGLVEDKDRIIFNTDFTFDKDGNFRSMAHVQGFPHEVGSRPPGGYVGDSRPDHLAGTPVDPVSPEREVRYPVFRFRVAYVPTIRSLLAPLNIRYEINIAAGEVIVWGNEADQEKAKERIDTLSGVRYPVFQFHVANVPTIRSLLAPLNIRYEIDTEAGEVIVWGNETDQEKAKERIDALNHGIVGVPPLDWGTSAYPLRHFAGEYVGVAGDKPIEIRFMVTGITMDNTDGLSQQMLDGVVKRQDGSVFLLSPSLLACIYEGGYGDRENYLENAYIGNLHYVNADELELRLHSYRTKETGSREIPDAIRKLPVKVQWEGNTVTLEIPKNEKWDTIRVSSEVPNTPLDDLVWATLGIRYVPSTQEHGGVRVWSVRTGSPAARGGIVSGDTITRIGQWSIESSNDIRWIAQNWRALQAEKSVKADVIRAGIRYVTEISTDGKLQRTEGFLKADVHESRERNAVERPDSLAGTPGDDKEVVTSLEKFLKIEGLKRYPVNKRIADFPADKIDLSTPEASYATQKNLIVSNRPDKMEQLSNMTQGRPPIPERERREMEQEVPEDKAKTYREKFDVFEVFVLEDEYAFVFGLRRFDMLYDGNYFVKDGDEWLNKGNEQSFRAEEIAASAQRFLSLYQQRAERIRSYTVDKKVTDYPAGAIDLLTPEAAYALGNRIIGDNNPDKIERLRHYTAGMSVPKHMEEWITNMPPEDRALMMNAEILHVFDYRDKHAMVVAEVVKGEKYSNRLFSKRDGHWFNTGGGGFYRGSSAEEVVKMNEGAFAKLADGWDKAMQNPGTAQSTAPSPALLANTTVAGVVTLDGKPLDEVIIMYLPLSGASMPAVGGNVSAVGQYAFKGVAPGDYKVVIKKMDHEGKVVHGVINPMYTEPSTTPFSVTVVEGKNNFNFALSSKTTATSLPASIESFPQSVDLILFAVDPFAVRVGGEATFVFSLQNRGPKMAENIEVKISFGSGLEPIAVRCEGSEIPGAKISDNGQVTFDIVALTGKGSFGIVVKAEKREEYPDIKIEVICKAAGIHLVSETEVFDIEAREAEEAGSRGFIVQHGRPTVLTQHELDYEFNESRERNAVERPETGRVQNAVIYHLTTDLDEAYDAVQSWFVNSSNVRLTKDAEQNSLMIVGSSNERASAAVMIQIIEKMELEKQKAKEEGREELSGKMLRLKHTTGQTIFHLVESRYREEGVTAHFSPIPEMLIVLAPSSKFAEVEAFVWGLDARANPVDLVLSAVDPFAVRVGGEATFVFSLQNRGPKMAENIEVKISFGSGLEPIAVRCEGSEIPGAKISDNGQVTFDIVALTGKGSFGIVVKAEKREEYPDIKIEVICKAAGIHLVSETEVFDIEAREAEEAGSRSFIVQHGRPTVLTQHELDYEFIESRERNAVERPAPSPHSSSIVGIGVNLCSEEGHVVIDEVLKGGPADKSGEIQANDRIVGIGQGKEGEIKNVIGSPLADVINLIRGSQGTVIRLEILPEGREPAKIIELVRDEVSFPGPFGSIGAGLQVEDGRVVVKFVFKGGSADRSGEIHRNDIIRGVGEGKDGEIKNVFDSRVVELIEGPKGTVVRLEVLPGGKEPAKIVELVRDDVNLANPPVTFSTPEGGFTHLVVYGPKGNFLPTNPKDYLNVGNPKLDEFAKFYMLGIHLGYFRTKVEDGKLMAYHLTTTPAEFREWLESIPQFEYIRTERLTQEMFEAFEKAVAESLPPADGG